jgi:transcriptional regulator with XRE-family HTH domain
MAIYTDGFAKAFSGLLNKSGVSSYKISHYTHLDQAYLSRLLSGEKKNPSIETIFKICLALANYNSELSIDDFEKLIKTSGHSLFNK